MVAPVLAGLVLAVVLVLFGGVLTSFTPGHIVVFVVIALVVVIPAAIGVAVWQRANSRNGQ